MRDNDDKDKDNVRGFKVFNPDWTFRGFQYEVGKTYEMDAKPECYRRGFYFCLKAEDCFDHYGFSPKNKVAEVVALGEVDEKKDEGKCCTNKIKVMREIPWEEVLRMVNAGNCNSGLRNSGDCNSGLRNSGNWNSGDYNSGNWNSGDCNSGNWNSGDCNRGNCNSGDYNSGNCNSGLRNSGDCNSGDWNKSSFNTGCFMTEEQRIFMFNKPSDWTYMDWAKSDARRILNQMPYRAIEWISSENMTEEEKEGNPTHETTGGYLKVTDEHEDRQQWWDALPEERRRKVMSLPNFDAEVFEQCTGIKADG